ncbi:MAG: hypothetical protein WAM70_00670 [Pyrinomonadaceae bacterium]
MKFSRAKIKLIAAVVALVFGVASSSWARRTEGSSPGGSIITNQARATYSDSTGETFETVSETVTLTVLAVASITVTPDETTASDTVGPREQLTRAFRVCNTGNTPDRVTLTQSSITLPAVITALYFDNDGSGTVTAGDELITLNQTVSPQLAPNGCVSVLAVIDTNDVAAQSTLTISITARSTASGAVNGRNEDAGTIINAVGSGARLTDPVAASLPPNKLVNGGTQAVVSLGSQFTYTIAFRNSGDTAARNVVMTDQLPSTIECVPSSLRINDNLVSDAIDADEGSVVNNTIQVRLPRVDPAQAFRVTFSARLTNAVPAGVGVVNNARFTSDNAPPAQTTDAVVVADPLGLVFAARGGSSAPIAGARIELFANADGTNLVTLPANSGFVPNGANANPFATDSAGHFSFKLSSESIVGETVYFMKISAPGFLTRMIQLTLRPTHNDLFALTAHAVDGQELADSAFVLVRNDITIEDLAALVMNIPMFEARGLQVIKSADRARVEIGDIVTYRVEVHNPTAATLSNVTVEDRLPESFHYAEGSALLSTGSAPQQSIEPQVNGSTLLFTIGDLPAGSTARLLYRVRIGVNAGEGDRENVAVASGSFPSGERTTSSQARATVFVAAGVFSARQVLLGRVFVDTNQNGQFDDGDRPSPGVRLYLNNGQSVITDSEGLYNFPALNDGSIVISLDPVSLPSHYALSDGGRYSGKSWTRLLRTPIGGGGLLRQNFALIETRSEPPASAGGSSTQASPEPVSVLGAVATESNGAGRDAGAPQAGMPALQTPGTYELASNEDLEPVPAGTVRVVSPKPNSVIMTPALEVEAEVEIDSTVKVEINGEEVSDKNIGKRRVDHKNKITGFTFVGLNVRPGPNKLRITPIAATGSAGQPQEFVVMGRGPARRLEIVTEKTEIQAGGSDSTIVRVSAFDQWGNPASDGDIGLETSLGELVRNVAAANDKDRTTSLDKNKSSAPLVLKIQGGATTVKLVSAGAPGDARLRATTGQAEAEGLVRITAEVRPRMLVGMAEMSFGKGIPEVGLRREEGNFRSRLSFFYSGKLFGDNMLTLSYDSQRPINRTAGRDRLFQLDPNDRVYPLFGDSSTRFEAAQTNSKLYARIDRKRSYLMFGDFEADMNAPLMGYGRKLTGVKLHLENSGGDGITFTGARPDTAFARDVFAAGSLGILQLSSAEILPGSENVMLEIRDRRNPEVVISRETLTRGIDYNLDPVTGQVFFLRYISTFDYLLNLTQIVVTYEHRANSMNSAVYTARAHKNFKSIGLKLGLSAVMQTQSNEGNFFLAGFDAEKKLPGKGLLQMAWAMSNGEVVGTGNVFNSDESTHNGSAYQIALQQPLPFASAVVRGRFLSASAGFFNPFGGTVTPGSRRGEVNLEMKPLANSVFRLGFTSEDNKTENVDNSRVTVSAAWEQLLHERVRLQFGFDHRAFSDDLNNREVDSNLVTVGAEVKVTDKLQLTVKREQNLGEADPSYPNQTTLGATYQVSALTKLFFTQRLASGTITPIGDYTNTGFAFTSARRETAFGVETRFGKYTSMVGRYQLENGISGTDSFAVIGLQNRLPLTKEFSLELGFERGFHLTGPNESFNSATLGFGWQPNEDFRANARYEFRDRNGNGQLFAAGAAGRVQEGVTALARVQWSRGAFGQSDNSAFDATAAVAFRPIDSDRRGLLFTYTHRSLNQLSANNGSPTRDRIDSLSTDAYEQLTKRLELYGRFSLRFTGNGQPELPFVSNLSYLAQARAQYLITDRIDWAVETRALFQPSSHTMRSTYATEMGFWAIPDLRLGGGYNFTAVSEPEGARVLPTRRGFYFTISTKLFNLFNLFGTSNHGLAGSSASPVQPEKK